MIAGLLGGLALFFLPTNLLAVVALGLMFSRAPRLPLQLALFAAGLAAGSLAIAYAVRETPAASALLVVGAGAGLIAAVAWTPSAIVAGILACATGLAVALNAAPQTLTIPAAVASQIGAGLSALATLAAVAFIATKAKRPWQRIGVRVVGSWVAASAILVLVLALRLMR